MGKQEQRSGDNSTNIQAGEIAIYQGLTYAEVKTVALDVFRANFYELVGKAKEVARERAEEITEKFLRKLFAENPKGSLKADDPDFQYSLFTVQKEFAKTGDKDLGDLLVDILVDRSKHEQRDLIQIVLNESLKTAPKLTTDQLAALSIIFIMRYSRHTAVTNHHFLGQFFDTFIMPFLDKLNKKMTCYQHLELCGCGSLSIGGFNIIENLGNIYQGLFIKGFDHSHIPNIELLKDINLFFHVSMTLTNFKLMH